MTTEFELEELRQRIIDSNFDFCKLSIELGKSEILEDFIGNMCESTLDGIVHKSLENDGVELTMKLIEHFKNYPQRIRGYEFLLSFFHSCNKTGNPDILVFKYHLSELIIKRSSHLEGLSCNLQNRFYSIERKLQLLVPRALDAVAKIIQESGEESSYEEIADCASKNSGVLNFFMDDITEASYELTTVENLLNCIDTFPDENKFFAYQSLFKAMKIRNQFYSSDVMMAAYRMSSAVFKGCFSEEHKSAFKKMKNELPNNVKAIIFNGKVHLKNTRFDEFVYSPSPDFAKDEDRLNVFSSKLQDDDGIWYFESDNRGKSFYIKCGRWSEYLHASQDEFNQNRNVYTWRNRERLDQSSFRWKIELVGEDYVRFKNEEFDEYLIVSNENFNEQFRYISTCTCKGKKSGADFEVSLA